MIFTCFFFSLERANRIVSIIVILIAYHILIYLYISHHKGNEFLLTNKSDWTRRFSVDSVFYSLESECLRNSSNSSITRQKQFNTIFETGRWDQVASRSGGGSSLEGAFDWIRHLRTFLKHYSIRSVADIPCGDTWWQFSLREMNTIEHVYFGGDISTQVIEQNQRLYGSRHRNKLFQYWDLVQCVPPTYRLRNVTHEIKGNSFDLIIVRDAIQHMNIKNGLKAVRNVVNSGARFFALSTYPPNGRSSTPMTRSIGNNQSLPITPSECEGKNYCTLGAIKDGDFYLNNINCPPFSFPLNRAILVQSSHEKFSIESDEIHIYPIDDHLKQIVKQYDQACL